LPLIVFTGSGVISCAEMIRENKTKKDRAVIDFIDPGIIISAFVQTNNILC
jgi:hypothetical protein